jgi:cell division protein FtsB
MTVIETVEREIEQLTSRSDALTAEVVKLRADIEEHYAYLGRQYYASRAELRTARASWICL